MEENIISIQGHMETTLVSVLDFQKEAKTFKALHANLRREDKY